MNVKSMTTNQLLNQWTKTDRGEDQPIIDELHRRCKAGNYSKFVDPESLYVFSFFTDRHGELRMFGEPKVAVFDDLDKYIETPPQLTDGLAFEPSDELDAANCIELTGLKNPSVPASRRSGWILNTERRSYGRAKHEDR